jgi:hypothetical protein
MEFPKKYYVSSDPTENSLIEYLENAKDGINAVCTLIGRAKNILMEDFDISKDVDRYAYETTDYLIKRLSEINDVLKRHEDMLLKRYRHNRFLREKESWPKVEAFNNGEE